MFDNTQDPERLTTDDIARWCEELGEFIKDNPDASTAWLENISLLYHKIKAAHTLMEFQRKDALQQIPGGVT